MNPPIPGIGALCVAFNASIMSRSGSIVVGVMSASLTFGFVVIVESSCFCSLLYISKSLARGLDFVLGISFRDLASSESPVLIVEYSVRFGLVIVLASRGCGVNLSIFLPCIPGFKW